MEEEEEEGSIKENGREVQDDYIAANIESLLGTTGCRGGRPVDCRERVDYGTAGCRQQAGASGNMGRGKKGKKQICRPLCGSLFECGFNRARRWIRS